MNSSMATPKIETSYHSLLLELKAGIFDRIGSDQLIKYFVRTLGVALGSEFTSFTHHAPNWAIIGVETFPVDATDRWQFIPKISEFLHEHPCVPFMEANKDRVVCVKITDFVTQEEFQKTNLYKYGYGPIGFDYMLAASASDESNCFYSINLTHPRRDFTEEDKIFVSDIYPFFLKAYRLNQLVHERYNQIQKAIDLTNREKEVLNWVGSGKTNEEIALLLNLSPRSIESHVRNLSKKMGFLRRVDLIKYASGKKYIRFRGLED